MAKFVEILIGATVVGIDYAPEDFRENPNAEWDETWGYQEMLYVKADGEDITKTKGKYIVTDELFKEMLPEPAYLYFDYYPDECVTQVYHIELEDNEEFDPKKLHLIKSTELWYNYDSDSPEFEHIPRYYILADYIIYNDKKVYMELSVGDAMQENPISKGGCWECVVTRR